MNARKTREPRDRQLNLSLTATELEQLKQRAEAVGQRLCHYARALVLRAGGGTATNAAVLPSNAENRIHAQLARLGNNLNQIARHCHRTGHAPPPALGPLLGNIRKLIARENTDDC